MAPAWLQKGATWPTPRKVLALSALFLAFPLVFLIHMYTSSEFASPDILKLKTPGHSQIPPSAESIVSAVTNATLGVRDSPSFLSPALPRCCLFLLLWRLTPRSSLFTMPTQSSELGGAQTAA